MRAIRDFQYLYGLDSDLNAWVARCTVKPGMDFLLAANDFILTGKDTTTPAGGWWQKLTAVYFFFAPTMQAAQQNVKSNAFNLTVHGTVSLSPNGITGDGSTGYLDTGATLGAMVGANVLTDNTVGVYAQYIVPGISGDVGARGGGTPVNQTGINLVRSVASSSVWNNETTQIVVSAGTGYGLNCNIRTSSAGGLWTTGATTKSWLTDAVAAPTGNLFFLRLGASGTYSANTLAFGFVGASLTTPQVGSLSDACDQMLRVLGVYVEPPTPTPPSPPNCFTNTTINSVTPAAPPFRILRLAAPPSSDSVVGTTDYPNFPLTDAVTRPWGPAASSTQTKIGIWELLWGDRGLGLNPGDKTAWAKNPNDTMGIIKNTAGYNCRTQFSTYRTAIGSTLVKQMWSAGYAARGDADGAAIAALLHQYGYLGSNPGNLGWLDAADAFGYDTTGWAGRSGTDLTQDVSIDTGSTVNPANPAVFHRAWAAAHADTFFPGNAVSGSFKVSSDMVILGQGRLSDLGSTRRGFALDCEMDDDRGNYSATDGTDLFTVTAMLLSAAAHGKGFLIGALTDPLLASGSHLGLTASNAATVMGASGLDFVNITTSATPPITGGDPDPQATWLQGQLDILVGVSASKICLELVIGGPGQEIAIDYVTSARTFLTAKGFTWSYIANGYGSPGGALSLTYNQVLATFYGLPTS
ncbi:hypothetical protein [Labrys wisconsinensis]|uniref:Uncharacterized protein n=1 Tax=Labrys wisconsinensis TaxID=425677 RepID=A0ABU0JN44_9HYPH|nr:hypothetical protein [Labrys wisconsinensis]MDQ0474572.1 hypothetical protein [Labrys wisconsinensis]